MCVLFAIIIYISKDVLFVFLVFAGLRFLENICLLASQILIVESCLRACKMSNYGIELLLLLLLLA